MPAHFYATVPPLNNDIARIKSAERFFAVTKANIVHGGSRACYIIARDHIHMPCIDCFRDAESYYATLAHETIHSTRHASRLDRDLGRKRFADAGYAMEELVAEIGAAFLCADLGITPETRDDHAAYIASWLQVLKNDKRAIFTAASHAQKAADYLHSLQPKAGRDRRRDAGGRIRIDRGGRAERRGLCRAGMAAGQGRDLRAREAAHRAKARRNILRSDAQRGFAALFRRERFGPDDSGLRGHEWRAAHSRALREIQSAPKKCISS